MNQIVRALVRRHRYDRRVDRNHLEPRPPIPLIRGLLLVLLAVAATTLTGSSQSSPLSLSGAISGQGMHPSGAFFVDLRLTNQGSDSAQNIRINQLPLRTLAGNGTVTY